ncbi:MAG: hypothetical protein MZW92_15980 [Comamonadaceae bacterium]|nr:hypothetical protein [Comamonadaceae bacterium]
MDDYLDARRAAPRSTRSTTIVPEAQGARGGLLHRRHAARDRARPRWRATGRRAARLDDDVRRADRLHRAGRAGVLHQPDASSRCSRRRCGSKGVLESRQMGGAFAAAAHATTCCGQPIDRPRTSRASACGVNDLMAWNADGTRMPYRMHTEYLHQLYLNNDLADGPLLAVGGKLIRLSDITRADVRRRHRDRPRRAVAVGLQGGQAGALGRLHVPA